MYLFIIFFVNVFFTINNYAYSSISHSGVIKCVIKPWRKTLENELAQLELSEKNSDKLAENASLDEQKNGDDFDEKMEQKNNVINNGDGLSIYLSQENNHHEKTYNLAEKILRRTMIGVDGIFAYYRGLVVISDIQGLIMFPRLEQDRNLTVVIASDIEPMRFTSDRPSSFSVSRSIPSEWYMCSAVEDVNSGMLTWKAEKITPPQDMKIPINALIIIANPKVLFFSSDPLTVPFSENFMLPDLFATEELTRGIYGLHALEALRYHQPLTFTTRESLLQPGVQYARKIFNSPIKTGKEALV